MQIPQLLKKVPRVSLTAKTAALVGVWVLVVSFILIVAFSAYVYDRYPRRDAKPTPAEFKPSVFSSADFGVVTKLVEERKKAYTASTTVANPAVSR